MAVIVRLSSNEDEENVFCILVVIAGIVIYKKMPFGVIEEPTDEEVLEFAKKKYDDNIIKQKKLNLEIDELDLLIEQK